VGAGTTTLPAHGAEAVGAGDGGCGSHAAAGGCGSGAAAGCGSHADAAGGGCGPCGGHAETPAESPATASAASEARTDLVAVRRRGAGTDLAPNA
ncbi:biotin synthase BioB, partial [Streptomyces filamentosus]